MKPVKSKVKDNSEPNEEILDERSDEELAK